MANIAEKDRLFLRRTLELAQKGSVLVEPNPKVGAVVVHNDLIIGEGFHQRYGQGHAEVNAVADVQDKSLLKNATLYVSLEPCNHYGKTPPCTQLILENKIPRVVVGSTDPNPVMAGKSLDFLRSKGVEVLLNEDQEAFVAINRHFWLNQQLKRAYITVKWAESRDRFIAGFDAEGLPAPTPLSGPKNQRFVHRLRGTHPAILVGSRTVLVDNPGLNTRLFPGPDPIKIILDADQEIPKNHPIFQSGKTLLIAKGKAGHSEKLNDGNAPVAYFSDPYDLEVVFSALYAQGIGSILVEGGAQVLNAILSAGIQDEVFVTKTGKELGRGVAAPNEDFIPALAEYATHGNDTVYHWERPL